MNLMLVVAAAVTALAVFAYLFRPARRRKVRMDQLRRQYLRLLQMPPAVAQATLDRVLGEMKRQYPQRTPQWHLKRMISDLERDRR
jgi:hypothetical protein